MCTSSIETEASEICNTIILSVRIVKHILLIVHIVTFGMFLFLVHALRAFTFIYIQLQRKVKEVTIFDLLSLSLSFVAFFAALF